MEIFPTYKDIIVDILLIYIPINDIVDYIYCLADNRLRNETINYYLTNLKENMICVDINTSISNLITLNTYIKYDILEVIKIISSNFLLEIINGRFIPARLKKKIKYINSIDHNLLIMDYNNTFKLSGFGLVIK
ncbi:MAG: hypothetical protein CMH79_04705 [Nitrospinae bacterium]|nr:hypothetical protein [Nitrospinota bacterium]|tara:strand:+ start:127 stop:528 length:402 start_codon:yes stop_codon:yes gene_type:complete